MTLTMDSYQYRVFKERYPFLQEGVKPAVAQLAHWLYSKGLIPKATAEAATLVAWTPDQKSSELLKALDSQIKANPISLYDFMAILRLIPTLRYLFRDLNERLPENLQPEFLEVPPCEEAAEETDGTFMAIPTDSQSSGPSMQAYIVQPLYSLPPSIVTGQTPLYSLPSTALPVYTAPPRIQKMPSFDMDELTSRLPLHILNRQCEDIPLTDISNEMSDYDSIYTYFGLTRIKMEDITRKYPRSPSRQRQDLLFEWRDMFGKRATYKELMYCFCQAKRQDLIDCTCEVVEKHYLVANSMSSNATTAASLQNGEAESVSSTRTACQLPTSAGEGSSIIEPGNTNEAIQDPSPTIPFQTQQSESQSYSTPGDVFPVGDTPRQQRHSSSSLSSDVHHLHLHGIEPQVPEAVQEQEATRLLSHTISGSYSRLSSVDSFHTACSQSPFPCSIDLLSDEETTEGEKLQEELDRITTRCAELATKKEKEVQSLKRKLKEKDRELKGLKELLAQKEQLSSRQVTSELDHLKKELELIREHVTAVELERKEVASECLDAQAKLDTCRSQNRGLHKEVMELRCKLFQSQQEAFGHRREKECLAQRVKELESSIDFFFSNSMASCRVRSHSF